MKKVLVVEDDHKINNLIEHCFGRDLGLQLQFCESYVEGLAQGRHNVFDLYLIDLNLDRSNGLSLIREISRSHNITNKVIVISADITKEAELEGYKLGVSNFLWKPLDIDILRSVMQKNLVSLMSLEVDIRSYGDITIELESHRVLIKSDAKVSELAISPTELRVLVKLVIARGGVVPKDELSFCSQDSNRMMTFKALEMHVAALRLKLSSLSSTRIVVRRGVGYFLEYSTTKAKAA